MMRKGKWFSGTENVLRYSKHNLPFAGANEIPLAGLGVSRIDFELAGMTFPVSKIDFVICLCK
jgi:hypothetical protein